MTGWRPVAESYRGVDVLVTGHTGFKGTWLTAWLVELGAHVTGLALEPELGGASLYARSGLDARIRSVIGDIRQADVIDRVVQETKPAIVFHLAAQALVRRSYREPVATIATNVMGTVNLLEAARTAPGVRGVVVVTSDKAYENPETGLPIPEDSPMGGRDPYSASKGATEIVTAAYRHSFFSDPDSALIACARAGNVIGPGDESEDRLLPDILRAIRAGEPVVIRNPSSTRPWQHVLEPLRGYLMLGARLLEGDRTCAEGWNFGPDPADVTPVVDLARQVVQLWGSGDVVVEESAKAPHEANQLSLDITKARQRLGFEPAMDVAGALGATVAGYRDLESGTQTPSAVIAGQISEYESKLS